MSITDDGLAVFDAADADLGAIVKNNYDFAKQVMELDEILNPQGRKAPAELEEEEPLPADAKDMEAILDKLDDPDEMAKIRKVLAQP